MITRKAGDAMSCSKCEEIQEANQRGELLGFLRVGRANVLIGACNEHFNDIRRAMYPSLPSVEITRVTHEPEGGDAMPG